MTCASSFFPAGIVPGKGRDIRVPTFRTEDAATALAAINTSKAELPGERYEARRTPQGWVVDCYIGVQFCWTA